MPLSKEEFGQLAAALGAAVAPKLIEMVGKAIDAKVTAATETINKTVEAAFVTMGESLDKRFAEVEKSFEGVNDTFKVSKQEFSSYSIMIGSHIEAINGTIEEFKDDVLKEAMVQHMLQVAFKENNLLFDRKFAAITEAQDGFVKAQSELSEEVAGMAPRLGIGLQASVKGMLDEFIANATKLATERDAAIALLREELDASCVATKVGFDAVSEAIKQIPDPAEVVQEHLVLVHDGLKSHDTTVERIAKDLSQIQKDYAELCERLQQSVDETNVSIKYVRAHVEDVTNPMGNKLADMAAALSKNDEILVGYNKTVSELSQKVEELPAQLDLKTAVIVQGLEEQVRSNGDLTSKVQGQVADLEASLRDSDAGLVDKIKGVVTEEVAPLLLTQAKEFVDGVTSDALVVFEQRIMKDASDAASARLNSEIGTRYENLVEDVKRDVWVGLGAEMATWRSVTVEAVRAAANDAQGLIDKNLEVVVGNINGKLDQFNAANDEKLAKTVEAVGLIEANIKIENEAVLRSVSSAHERFESTASAAIKTVNEALAQASEEAETHLKNALAEIDSTEAGIKADNAVVLKKADDVYAMVGQTIAQATGAANGAALKALENLIAANKGMLDEATEALKSQGEELYAKTVVAGDAAVKATAVAVEMKFIELEAPLVERVLTSARDAVSSQVIKQFTEALPNHVTALGSQISEASAKNASAAAKAVIEAMAPELGVEVKALAAEIMRERMDDIRVALDPIELVRTEVLKNVEPIAEAAAKNAQDTARSIVETFTPVLLDQSKTQAITAADENVKASVLALRADLDSAIATAVTTQVLQQVVELVPAACADAMREALPQLEAVIQVQAKNAAAEEATAAAEEVVRQRATDAVRGLTVESADRAADARVEGITSRVMLKVQDLVENAVSRMPVAKDGTPGRDARVLAPVPYKEGTAYEQGVWVTHKAGVWVSARHTATEPHADNRDWDCVAPGLESVNLASFGKRSISFTLVRSDGQTEMSTVKLPIPVACGVYSDKTEYEQFDLVTYDGSQWQAQKDIPEGKPGMSQDWKLVVKRGKDGKDLKQPEAAVIRHVGEWKPDTLYMPNQTVDHAGVRWLAMLSTRERPPFTTLKSNDVWTKLGA